MEEKKQLKVVANTPDNLYKKCSNCNENILKEELELNLFVCPYCDNHARLRAIERLNQSVDQESFEELLGSSQSQNPLNMPDYTEKLMQSKQMTNMNEAVMTGTGKINGYQYAIAIMDSHFMMGSMGTVVGEKITTLVELATEKKLPLLIFSTSGGARMQEGILSLMQMAKTSAAIGRHHQAGLLYISVLTHPTTGGVSASFASLGDITLAEPNALIGFAGPRVIKQTINEDLPEGFQRSEFLIEKGFVDQVVRREDLKETLTKLSELHQVEVRI
jgi:acetyl-CoA carboxylase carboxyl transferase subunit beta